MSVIVFVLTLDEIDGTSIIMPQVKKEWADEIVFVDGGSTDGTIEKAGELGFRVIHQKNKGEGNACRVGTDATKSDYVMFFSPDGNDVPEDIPKLIEAACELHKQELINEPSLNDVLAFDKWARGVVKEIAAKGTRRV